MVSTLLPMVKQATGINYCRHCLHALPRCTCVGAPVEASQPAALPVSTPSSASVGLSVAASTAGSTAVVTPITPLLGHSAHERQNLKSVWRAQIDEMRRQKQRLEEEANADYMEYQQAFLELQEAKAVVALRTRPPLL